MGGIYSGHCSPTEAAVIALAYAILVECVIYREPTLADLRDKAIELQSRWAPSFPFSPLRSA
ncbi:hypothetical protein [Ruegeria denitrificans]|uniref:hypothetical protein n=1 Tax=Ruegeria denitrificans TaxID=1715692 RepID=UPI0009E6B221|nr:hypothetical protein [Ruegeria denitrificans]